MFLVKLWISTLAIAFLLAAGCGEHPTPDAQNPRFSPPTTSSTPAEARQPRLVVLSPGLSLTIKALGHEHTVVGRHGFDLALNPALPVVGDQVGINHEMLAKVNPTVVLIQEAKTHTADELRSLGGHAGWQVKEIPSLTLQSVRNSIALIDRAARHAADDAPLSPKATALIAQWDAALSPVANAAPLNLGRTLSITSVDPAGAMGPGSYHADIVETLGATALPQQGLPYQQLSAERIAKLNPDTLIIYAPEDDRPLTDLLGPLAGLNLSAVTQSRVIVIRDTFSLLPSVSLIDVANHIREAAQTFGPLTP